MRRVDLPADNQQKTRSATGRKTTSIDWDAVNQLMENSPDNTKFPKSVYKTEFSFVKFNGSLYAIQDFVGDGSVGVKVKHLISENANKPSFIIKRFSKKSNNGYFVKLISQDEFDKLGNDAKNEPYLVQRENNKYVVWGCKDDIWQLTEMEDGFTIPDKWLKTWKEMRHIIKFSNEFVSFYDQMHSAIKKGHSAKNTYQRDLDGINKGVRREVEILKDLRQAAEAIAYEDKDNQLTIHSAVMPFAGETLYRILEKTRENFSYEYVAKKPDVSAVVPGKIYLNVGENAFYYLDVNNHIETGKLKIKNIVENDVLEAEQLQAIVKKISGKALPLFNVNYQPLSPAKRFDMAIKLCLEVHKLHQGESSITQTPYIHADLHPGNVALDGEKVSLIDFGGAQKITDDLDVSQLGTKFEYRAIGAPGAVQHDDFSLMRCLYKPISRDDAVISEVDKLYNILTDEMLDEHQLKEYFNTENGYCRGMEPNCQNPDIRQPAAIEVAAVLINAKMELGLNGEQLKDKRIVSMLALHYEQGLSRGEMLAIINQPIQPMIVVGNESKLTSMKNKVLGFMKENPVLSGILIGLGVVILASVIVAAIYFTGGAATIPIVATANFFGGAFLSGAAAGALGAALIGLKLFVAGVVLGAIGGLIAKFCVNKDAPVISGGVVNESTTKNLRSAMPQQVMKKDEQTLIGSKSLNYNDSNPSLTKFTILNQEVNKAVTPTQSVTNSKVSRI